MAYGGKTASCDPLMIQLNLLIQFLLLYMYIVGKGVLILWTLKIICCVFMQDLVYTLNMLKNKMPYWSQKLTEIFKFCFAFISMQNVFDGWYSVSDFI